MSDLIDTLTPFVGKVPYDLGAPVEAMGWSAANMRADCSSFVKWGVQRVYGIDLPRPADQQFRATEAHRVGPPYQRNDLAFFGGWVDAATLAVNPPGYKGVQHVAVLRDATTLIEEAPPNVKITALSAYGRHLLFVTRPFGDNAMNFSGLTPLAGRVKVAKGGAQYKDASCTQSYPEGNPGYADVGLYAFGKRADGLLLAAIKRPDGAVGFVDGKLATLISPATIHIALTVDPDGTVHLS